MFARAPRHVEETPRAITSAPPGLWNIDPHGDFRHQMDGKCHPRLRDSEFFVVISSSWWFFATPLKNMLVKLDHFPKDRGENEKYLSCHHPVFG